MIKKIRKQVKLDVERFNLICGLFLVLWGAAFVVIVLSDEPRQNQGRGLVDRKLVKAPPPPSNFIVCRPKAALLFWFFVMWCAVIYRYSCYV